jgi:transcription elongation factor GreA
MVLYNIITKNAMDEKTFYVTKAKLQELKKEYEKLLDFERCKTIGEEAPKIFESEDINPEFISFQEDMSFLRSRIDELKNILEHYELIKNPIKVNQNIVGIGAKIKVDVNGKKDEFTIVGTLEVNPALGKISNESPVGKALLGHKAGDEIVVSTPVKTVYKIKEIKYEIS